MTTEYNGFEQVLKIGSKGEIFPPKNIRKKLGLTHDQPIIMSVHNNKLIIRKLHSLEEILKEPAKLKISYHAFKEMNKEINEDLEK